MSKKFQIAIFGPQGSGKGTQAELLAKKLKIPVITMGNIYRQQIIRQSRIGKLAARYVDKGRLVPSDITNTLLAQEIKKLKNRGFILDGYPRDKSQLKALKKIARINYALLIWITDREAMERISGRRSCLCGQTYHLKFNPPKVDELCDKCGQKLIIRPDDKIPAIKKRLQIYHKQTEPLLRIYKKQGILIKINGMPSIKKVHQDIVKHLKLVT